LEIAKDVPNSDEPGRGQKKRWNTPALTEFGKVSQDNQPRAALGASA
jgi:hypothetical protein